MHYNWQYPAWPHFEYDLSGVQATLYNYARESSVIMAALDQFPENYKQEALLELMVSEAISTAAIEGEFYSQIDVRSSIRNQLGMNKIQEPVHDPRAIGVADLLLLSRQNLEMPLTQEMLWQWHDALIADPYQRSTLQVGGWRLDPEPMQIVSGVIGRQRIHFGAPPTLEVPQEMKYFLDWFNKSHHLQAPVRAAIAHIYFESIHPFADGNGRIGRAISERILSQEFGAPILFSLSSQIMKNKKAYYQQLAEASQYSLNITSWVTYFCRLILEAQLDVKDLIQFTLKKARFWAKYSDLLPPRQTKVIKRIFDAGKDGFMGGISAKKYMAIGDCSKATATRDLAQLVEWGCLYQLEGGGRNTRYDLAI